MRKLKKGFTIIELVIVIAVIAILTAVLVPTFISLSKKGKDTLDKNIVTNANIQLAASEGLEGKNRSMSEAVKDVDQIGYHMSTVQTNNGNMIVWDQVNDRFVLLDKDGNVILKDGRTNVPSDQNKLFYPIEKLSDRGEFKFAIYAKELYEGPTSFTSATSFDAGEKEGIESISYEFTSNSEVLVVTNSEDTTLNVKAPNADFKHVGLCGKIDIKEVADDSFNDHGHVGYVEIESGHYVADEGSNIKAVYATSDSAKVDQQNGGQIASAYGADLDYSETNSKGNVELQYLDYDDNHKNIEEQAIEDLDHEINPPSGPALVGSPVSNFLELAAAFANGGEYYLTANFEVTSALQTTHDLVLDLNGHNLNLNSSNNISATVLSASNCNITFNDSLGTGGIYNIKESYTDALFGMFGAGDFIINGGTFLSTDDMLFGGVGGTSGGRFVINGGTILGYVGTLQGKTIVLGQEMTLKYVNDALPLEFLDTHVVGAEGYTVTKSGDWDPIIFYVCTKN